MKKLKEIMIAEASFTGFIKTLFVVILVIFGLRLLLRFLMPYMLRFFAQKLQQNIQRKFQQAQQEQNQDNKIDSANAKYTNPKSTKKVGEYIDYEEIE
nr:DUF4834 family protein [Capnocytophaga canimorsus]